MDPNLFTKKLRECFDFVKNHLLTQNERSGEKNDCKYRSGNLKCAVGCLIPDDCYTEKLEGSSAEGLLRPPDSEVDNWWRVRYNEVYALSEKFRNAIGLSKLDADQLKRFQCLLGALQAVHDNNEVEDWSAKLSEVEKEFNLSLEA